MLVLSSYLYSLTFSKHLTAHANTALQDVRLDERVEQLFGIINSMAPAQTLGLRRDSGEAVKRLVGGEVFLTFLQGLRRNWVFLCLKVFLKLFQRWCLPTMFHFFVTVYLLGGWSFAGRSRRVRTYSVIPLFPDLGALEWVRETSGQPRLHGWWVRSSAVCAFPALGDQNHSRH